MTEPKPQDESLDRLLRDWSDQQQPDGEHLRGLADQIVEAGQIVEASAIVEAGEGQVTPVSITKSKTPVIWGVVGLAAGLLLAVGIGWLLREQEQPVAIEEDLPPRFAWLSDQQLSDKREVLHEMEAIFNEKLTWVVETSEDVHLGIEKQSRPTSAEPTAIRIVVQRRPVGQSDWSVAWAADVVSRSEEVVRLQEKGPQPNQLAVWSYVMPDGAIALETELRLGGEALEVQASEVHTESDPHEILRSRKGDVEFRVFQSASTLSTRGMG